MANLQKQGLQSLPFINFNLTDKDHFLFLLLSTSLVTVSFSLFRLQDYNHKVSCNLSLSVSFPLMAQDSNVVKRHDIKSLGLLLVCDSKRVLVIFKTKQLSEFKKSFDDIIYF